METMHIFKRACKPIFFNKLLYLYINLYIKCIDDLDIV